MDHFVHDQLTHIPTVGADKYAVSKRQTCCPVGNELCGVRSGTECWMTRYRDSRHIQQSDMIDVYDPDFPGISSLCPCERNPITEDEVLLFLGPRAGEWQQQFELFRRDHTINRFRPAGRLRPAICVTRITHGPCLAIANYRGRFLYAELRRLVPSVPQVKGVFGRFSAGGGNFMLTEHT